ncbi:MAG: hypothetical protein WCS72_01790 [Deltaproteobacteria bacterium]
MPEADPAQPWRSDRSWDPSGEPGRLGRRVRRLLWWGAASAAVLLPWNVLAALRPDLLRPGVVIAADLLPVALLLRGAWLRNDWRRLGSARLRFDRFPFFLGEPFEAVLVLSPVTGEVGAVEITLACLERRPGEGGAPPREVEVYRATQVILPGAETAFAFELPGTARQLGTSFRSPAARRWELQILGRAGARVQESFPVPVYAPPVDGEPAAG